MKQLSILYHATVMEKQDSLHGYFGWPTVARLQDGRLAAVASGFRRAHVCPFGKAVISYSEDGGRTWTDPCPVIDTPLDDRDAGILVYGEQDVLVTSFNNSVEFQRTWLGWRTDNLKDMPEGHAKEQEKADIAYCLRYLDLLDLAAGGEQTETDGVRSTSLVADHESYYGSTFKFSHDGGKTFGKLYFSPITAPHGPIALSDGRLIYVGTPMADIVRKAADPRIRCCEISPDGTVTELGIIPPIEDEHGPLSACEPHAVELADGGILVHIRAERGTGEHKRFTVYQTVSRDGGRTFPVPTLVPLVAESVEGVDVNTLGAPPHIFRHSSGALISVIGVRVPPYGIRALISRDEGESWEVKSLLPEAASYDLGYPSTCELSDGTLFSIWYEHTDTTKPATVEGVRWAL